MIGQTNKDYNFIYIDVEGKEGAEPPTSLLKGKRFLGYRTAMFYLSVKSQLRKPLVRNHFKEPSCICKNVKKIGF